ncbi:MAG TPA: hypothetical protein VMU95_00310 [Trebonia sp.]|nr:hypothetical protein [Trebonia sp.]
MTTADSRRASMPRWRAPELPAAASYLACWFGERAREQAEDLLATADQQVPVQRAGFPAQWSPAAEAELGRLVGDSRTGVRIILAGPEAVVARAMSLARQHGACSAELVPVPVEAAGEPAAGPAVRRVYCVSCGRPFDAVAALGGTVGCPSCAAVLTVDTRYSRSRAAHLGWPSGGGPRH